MKVCKMCGSTIMQAELNPEVFRVTADVSMPDIFVTEALEAGGRKPNQQPLFTNCNISIVGEITEKQVQKIRCSKCGSKDIEDQVRCPQCMGRANQLVYCLYADVILCDGCVDRATCRLDCTRTKCPLHPRNAANKDKPWAKPWDAPGGNEAIMEKVKPKKLHRYIGDDYPDEPRPAWQDADIRQEV